MWRAPGLLFHAPHTVATRDTTSPRLSTWPDTPPVAGYGAVRTLLNRFSRSFHASGDDVNGRIGNQKTARELSQLPYTAPRGRGLAQTYISGNLLRNMPRRSGERNFPKCRPAGSCRLAQTLRPLRASKNFEISGARKPQSLKNRALRAPRRPP